MKRLFVGLVAACLLALGTAAAATYYPNSGDFQWDGVNYADSYFWWDSPGPFTHSDVGYEHDLNVSSGFASDCTSWTNLPDGYDDCPTMGSSDPAGRAIASFGSYHINGVNANTMYFGNWTLKHKDCSQCPLEDPSGSTSASLAAQEVEHYFCSYDDPWCMNGIRATNLLVNMSLSVGTTYYEGWSY